MSERAPIATESSSVGIQPALSEPLRKINSPPATRPLSRRADGWGLAIETALSPESEPRPPFSSPPVSTLAEAAGQQKDVHLWRSLARACAEKGKHSEALVYATEAIRMQPDDVASLSLLAQLSEKQHADEAAAHWHQQVLGYDPGRKTSNRFLAYYHYCHGTYEKAVPYFTRLLEAEPKSRLHALYYLLARVKTSDIRGVADLLVEVRGWQQISSEERILAHELFFLIGSQSLKNYHVLFATRYLTWAEDLIPTLEGAALLEKAVALSSAVMESPEETSAHVPEPATLEEEHGTPYYNLEPRTFLQPLMTTVGVVALAVALGFPLFFAQSHSFLPWQKGRFLPSEDMLPQRFANSMAEFPIEPEEQEWWERRDTLPRRFANSMAEFLIGPEGQEWWERRDTLPQRFSDSTPVAPESVPTDQIRKPSPSSGALSPQAEPVTPPPDSDTRVKVAAVNNSPIKGRSEPTAAALLPEPESNPKPKPVISEQSRRSEGTQREQKLILPVPTVTTDGPAVVANSTAPKDPQPQEQETVLLPSTVAPQPNQLEEPLDQFAVASAPQHETEVQESPLPVNDVAPESADSSPPVELAAIPAPLPVEQHGPGKIEEAMESLSLSSPVEETESVIAALSSQLPFARQFPTREREVALSPEQLWPQLKALVEQETEVLLREDKEQGVLHGTILQRQLRPRLHTFKPYGHYLVEVAPGATVGTSLVRAKILTFDWRTKRPLPDADSLADRFLQKIGVEMK